VAAGTKEAFYTRSLVQPNKRGGRRPVYIIPQLASVAESMPAWGSSTRDKALRNFMRSEDMISSAVFTMAARYAGLPFNLVGGPRTVAATREMLYSSEHGKGLHALWSKVATDALSCDNAGWIEIYREKDSPESPPVQLNHLDTLKCHRTGDWESPIEYEDADGKYHKMMWYQVMELNDNPQPDEDKYGLGFCAVSRCLRAAQILKDINIYDHEKISGQFNRRITIVNGVGPKQIEEALTDQSVDARARGLLKYIQPAIMNAVDPRAPLNKIDIDLAMLPESWDTETFMRWLVIKLALAFGEDPQLFAPLSGNALGSSQQSEVLDKKGRTRGPNLWMTSIEHQFRFLGVIPSNESFEFGEQDDAVSIDKARANLMKAQELAILVKAGIISGPIAAQIYADLGLIDPSYLKAMGNPDLTPSINLGDTGSVPSRNPAKLDVPSSMQPLRLGGGTSNATSDQQTTGGVR
jgi:hypothetical protein